VPAVEPIEIRPIPADQWKLSRRTLNQAFGGANFWDEDVNSLHERAEAHHRTLAAFDGDAVVGTTATLAHTITVPGAVRPAACVSAVGVAPTHRRRGILTALMRAQLDAVHAEGVESFAALWASEPPIYQRFGYGCASQRAMLDVDLSRADYSAEGMATLARFMGDLTLGSAAEMRPLLVPVFERLLGSVPGMMSRDDARWDIVLHDSTSARRGAGPLEVIVAVGPDGAPVGYAGYRTSLEFGTDGAAGGRIDVTEVLALDPPTYAALWRHLLDLSLYSRAVARKQSDPEPLLKLLADPRRAGGRSIDALWIRLVDVPRALEERTYSAPLGTTLRVHDAFCPWNDGVWRVDIDPMGAASVERAPEGADVELELSAAELAAAHLGAVSLTALAAAGRVLEHRPGALVAASRAWTWHDAPLTLDVF
jgi:predicted acetyltransferase